MLTSPRMEERLWKFNSLSKKYGITASSICGWYYERHAATKYHRNSELSEKHEEQLFYAILTMSSVDLDWSIKEMQKAAKTMFGIDFSHTSAWRFKDHH